MDAKKIYDLFRSTGGPLTGRLQFGAGLTEVRIRRVEPQGMIVTGQYIPHRRTTVKVLVDDLAVEGLVGSRTDVQCRIKFLRPAQLETPY